MDSLSSINSLGASSTISEPVTPTSAANDPVAARLAASAAQPVIPGAGPPFSVAVADAPSPAPQSTFSDPLPANIRYAPSAPPHTSGDKPHFDRVA